MSSSIGGLDNPGVLIFLVCLFCCISEHITSTYFPDCRLGKDGNEVAFMFPLLERKPGDYYNKFCERLEVGKIIIYSLLCIFVILKLFLVI